MNARLAKPQALISSEEFVSCFVWSKEKNGFLLIKWTHRRRYPEFFTFLSYQWITTPPISKAINHSLFTRRWAKMGGGGVHRYDVIQKTYLLLWRSLSVTKNCKTKKQTLLRNKNWMACVQKKLVTVLDTKCIETNKQTNVWAWWWCTGVESWLTSSSLALPSISAHAACTLALNWGQCLRLRRRSQTNVWIIPIVAVAFKLEQKDYR